MSLSVYVTGLMTGLSLIVAIGAQNALSCARAWWARTYLRSVSRAACQTRP